MIKTRDFEITNDLNKYIGTSFECECGQIHRAPIAAAVVQKNAIEKIPEVIKDLGCASPLVVSDVNTEIAAGKAIKYILKKHNIKYKEFTYPDNHLIADPEALGRLLVNTDTETDIIIAVGSGTLNDICKFIAFKTGKKMMIAATAASMDGFLTNVSILTINDLKSTKPSMMPDAMIADVGTVSDSPLDMLAAGVGDMLGKPVSLLDWKIANLIKGDKYCEFIDVIVDLSYNEILKEADKLKDKNESAIANVLNGLILLGFGMAYSGTSQPGSGAEHQLSHFWEMTFAKRGLPPVYHGAKVGIGTGVCLNIWKILKDTEIDFNTAKKKAREFSYDKWRHEIERVYGYSCEDVFLLEEKSHKNNPDTVIKNIELLETNWRQILDWASSLPGPDVISDILKSMDAPYMPSQIGVDRELFVDTIYYAKDMRNRYSVLQILFDLGLTEQITQKLLQTYY